MGLDEMSEFRYRAHYIADKGSVHTKFTGLFGNFSKTLVYRAMGLQALLVFVTQLLVIDMTGNWNESHWAEVTTHLT